MKLIERTRWTNGRHWTVSVLLLSLPCVIFVVLHALYVPSRLPEFLDVVVAWTITLTGIVGAATTLAAVVVAVVATLQNKVSRTAKVLMWISVSLSVLAYLYLSTVPP
jgi:hypothetical protein